MLTLTSYGFLALFGIKECRKRNTARIEANARNRDNGNSGGGSANVIRNPLLVSRSWTYTRNPLSGDNDSALTGIRGSESERLLPEGRLDGKVRGSGDGGEESEYTRGKSKGDERVYQTAIEYLVDGDGDGSDSYPLPAAPATTFISGF